MTSLTATPVARRPRARRRSALSFALAGMLALTLATQGASAAEAGTSFVPTVDTTGGIEFLGTLGTSPTIAAKESAAGIKVAMMELSWKNYETAPGVFNVAYENQMKGRLASLRAAGMHVTLGLGLHFTPSWILDQPGSRMVDQTGKVSAEADLVFNQDLRDQTDAYLARVNAALGFANFWSVRITSGGRSELIYPEGMTYWAFGDNAQNGAEMPESMARNPFPGWKPGTAGLTKDQVKQWAIWYVDGLANVAKWQMQSIRDFGFQGWFEILTPGTGVFASSLTQLATKNLPASYLGAGAFWTEIYEKLSTEPNVVANISSLADGSAANNLCTANDRNVSLGAVETQKWSSARWISRIADEYGLKKVGENPQYRSGNAAFYTDLSATGMMGVTMRQATACGFFGVYWAHDNKLWDGTLPLGSFSSYSSTAATHPEKASA